MTSDATIHIAVASGKGGTGKSLLATNLFYSLQQHGMDAMLVDCDAEAPNCMLFFNGVLKRSYHVTQRVPVIDESKCTYCGKCQEYCHYHAIFILPPVRVIQVIDDLCHGCGACSVACEDNAITEKDTSLGMVTQYAIKDTTTIIESRMHPGVYSPVSLIKAAIQEAKGRQHVILDAPPGTSCPFIHTVARANFVVLITEPTPFGLSDLKQSVAVLQSMNKPCGVVINRAGMGNEEVYKYLTQESLPLLMEIPFSREIAATNARGALWAKSDSEFKEKLLQLFQRILFRHGNRHHQR